MHLNPSHNPIPGRYPHPVFLRKTVPRVHALTPMERAERIFKERLAPLGCRVEFGPTGEGGVFIEMASIRLTDYGQTLEQAILNFVESAREVADMKKAPDEQWTKDLEHQHSVLKKALAQ
jgi:hypothetical protein